MEKEKSWLRIAELEKISGTARRTIHFYLQQGLLHNPIRTGKTMAYYDESHLRRLKFIAKAKLQGLPLVAIQQQIEELLRNDPAAFGEPSVSLPSEGFGISSGVCGSSTSVPKRKQGRKTREAILDAGCELFRENGYRETRISDVTKALDIGKGTFYFYFSNKQELLLECVPRLFDRLFSDHWETIRTARDPQKRLEQRAYAVMPVLKEFCAIIQLSKEAMEDDDPKLRTLGKETYLSIRDPLELDIKKGIQRGQFKPVDPKITATMMIGLIENLYYMQSFEKQLNSEDVWKRVFELIIYGIKQSD